ncbi:hypothetical protein [uncultured Brachyspira sp.]|uniref:hypothetical protein n=1 Tax=uncultured Brachyspira sp. TaxID=221953 RepID=UPI0025E39EA6|nr:hypothetical protein [uncultured Brachyspira sp.]
MSSLRKELEKREFETLDLFTISFSLFRYNFANFLILALIYSLPLILIGIYFPIPAIDAANMKNLNELADWLRNDAAIGFYINILFSWFLDTISVISVSLLTERLIYGSIKSASWAIIKSFKFLIPALFTAFIYFVLVFLGLTFFIVPGIALIVFFVFFKNICTLRHTWGINALRYSYYLVKPKFFKTLFILGFIFFFQQVFAITFFPASIENRENLLSFFIAMIVLHIFDIYFKIIIALFFLNRDYISSIYVYDEDKEDDKDNNKDKEDNIK